MKFESFNINVVLIGIAMFLLYAAGILALFAGGVFIFKTIMGL